MALSIPPTPESDVVKVYFALLDAKWSTGEALDAIARIQDESALAHSHPGATIKMLESLVEMGIDRDESRAIMNRLLSEGFIIRKRAR